MMNAHIILQWLLCFGVFIYLQALFIHGVKGAMDGATETLPNGKKKDGEMLLYPFYKWITAKERPVRIYYDDAQFKEFIQMIYVVYRDILPGSCENSRINIVFLNTDEEVEIMRRAAVILRKEISVGVDINMRNVMFYKEYDKYKLSKWIRKPLGECIKCMASAWTIPTFWPVTLFLFGFEWWLFPLWVFNIACVSYMNVLIFKK